MPAMHSPYANICQLVLGNVVKRDNRQRTLGRWAKHLFHKRLIFYFSFPFFLWFSETCVITLEIFCMIFYFQKSRFDLNISDEI